MTQPSSPHQSNPPQTTTRSTSHANFIEALKSTGSSLVTDTVHGISQDLIAGTTQQTLDTIFNTNSVTPSNTENQPPFDFSEYLKSSEAQIRAQEKVKYEYERQETVIFNRHQQEIDQKINHIRAEIQKIAQEVVSLDQSIQTVIHQEITHPGTYHLNFFEKLLSFLQILRKRVTESRHWASLQSQRIHAQSYYWHMANQKVAGTKFLLSQERTVATQTG